MEIPSPPPPPSSTTIPTTTTTTTNLDPDDRIQPTQPIHIPKQLPPPFTNGVLKRHKPYHQNHHHPPVVVTYKECLKNHAASIGGHALDGCGEFMPSSMSSPTDPTSIKCAACGCHRNFHRRDHDPPSFSPNPPPTHHVIEYQPHHRHHPPPPPPPPISVAGARDHSLSPAESPSPPPISSSYYHPSAPHMLLALSSGLTAPPPENTPITGKKRFRTKFTQDQKDKMHELAERVGWKMQKKDEELIIAVCNEIGVEKGVFKVWMHNNKMTFGKKDAGTDATDAAAGQHQYQHLDTGSSGGGVDFLNRNQHHQPPLQNNNDSVSSGGGNVTGTNGSSSSS